MEMLPLTGPLPWDEVPAAPMETLFPEIAPPGMRPVSVTVTVPLEGGGHQVTVSIVAPEAVAGELLMTAFGACRGVPDFELVVRPGAAG